MESAKESYSFSVIRFILTSQTIPVAVKELTVLNLGFY